MARAIGILAAEHIVTAMVANNEICGPVHRFPGPGSGELLADMPAEVIVERIANEVHSVAKAEEIDAVGLGFPGIIRNGIVEDSPNLPQTKGSDLKLALSEKLQRLGKRTSVSVFNDADAIAAGIAAKVGQLDRMIRVWTLGNGIGFGRYPRAEGMWEGGHVVVSLDPKEDYCGCGGMGHLEGIMGHHAMRLRFLDLEPEEVFAKASAGDSSYEEFVKLWHRALAAGCAATIHLDGPGKFFVTGPNAQFLDVNQLSRYVDTMVTMSPLQGSSFQIMQTGDEVGALGAAVDAGVDVAASSLLNENRAKANAG